MSTLVQMCHSTYTWGLRWVVCIGTRELMEDSQYTLAPRKHQKASVPSGKVITTLYTPPAHGVCLQLTSLSEQLAMHLNP